MADDDAPIPLKAACELYPQAKLTVSALRAEAARGRLTIFRLGRRDYTTERSLKEMIRKCQDVARRHASTSTQKETPGLSAMERASSAQAALNVTVLGLKRGLRNISGKNTVRRLPPIR